MIVQEKVKDLVVIGEDTSKKAKISGDKLAKLQYLLTKGLYKDPITAVIAEWTNNGIDSVVQAGKSPIENPVLVKINRKENNQYIFSVEDTGVGLDNRDFEDICMNYLESTKENDNDTIGHFGIGMKSFLSLERSASFTCRKDGVERKYLVYEGAEFVNYDLIYERPTKEPNGVLAELVINSWNERELFIKKAKAKLAYYDTAVLIIDNVIVTNDIHRNDLFQWSTLNQNHQMHLCLKDVYYTIDYEALGIKPIDFPVAIRLQLGDGLTPTPSRESYITNEKTKELLLGKIREIADWFVTKYNETVKEFKTFLDAYDYLDMTNFYVTLPGRPAFHINSLVPYTKHKIASPKVVGITLRKPEEYKNLQNQLLYEYSAIGYVNANGVLRTKENRLGKGKEYHIIREKAKTIEVGDNFRGNVREFLKQKYGRDVMYVRRNNLRRKLGKAAERNPVKGQIKFDYDSYRHVLSLTTKPKNTWRDLIKEWQFVISTITSTFINEKDVDTTKEYIDWLEKKRDNQRKNRKLNSKGTTKNGLNKQVGDVTMAYSYRRYSKIFFKKEVFRIEKLVENKFVTVILTEEDALDKVKPIIAKFEGLKTPVRFAIVTKLERKKIPLHYQFINLKQFMSRECKPFMRMASAIMFEKALEDLEEIRGYNSGIFVNFLKPLAADEKILRDYVSGSLRTTEIEDIDGEIKGYILDIAKEQKLFDLSIWDVYQRVVDATKKYDFINLLKEPPSYDTATRVRYNRLINQILLFRKKFYNDLPDGTKIVFEGVGKV